MQKRSKQITITILQLRTHTTRLRQRLCTEQRKSKLIQSFRQRESVAEKGLDEKLLKNEQPDHDVEHMAKLQAEMA